jgi:hypothetical protein
MNRPGFDNTKFFVAQEVEHTACHGMLTLFVVGLQPVEQISAVLENLGTIPHIFFGANDSFHPHEAEQHLAWERMIQHFLDQGYWCSLDIPLQQVEQFHDGGLCDHNQFVPIIKVPVPYIKLWNYNTCVKIDDRDFNSTNPGVWVHDLHTLLVRDRFTPWQAYSKDQSIS